MLLRLTSMANPTMHAAVWAIFVLSYGQLDAAADTESRLADLEELAAKVDLSVFTNTAHLEKLSHRVHELQGGTRKDEKSVRQVVDPNIGFDAVVSNVTINLGDQQTILFDKIRTNQGSGYNAANGRFTCPQNGLYQFASTIPSKLNGTVDCEMVMDNAQVGRFRANHPGFDQATQVLVLECRSEQQVWLRHFHGANDTSILSSTHRYMASFTGHLIAFNVIKFLS
ncbi:heavy metal-binding protein HIP-like [Pecten maximus]|uniref:heavy metal-binding protein HIP-like n=1 Tax=Pecten maximus TaxID=6579 RepID=UPI0014582F7A|nr:heavy metal-binding protein HIP-like [Pecten maximus]